MTAACARCADLAVERADELVRIGGSPDPFSSPWGELRACRACGAYFRYTRDHDNEIGYQEAPPSLDRLDRDRALHMAEEAVIVARRQHAYFAVGESEYARDAAARYEAELRALAEALATLHDA